MGTYGNNTATSSVVAKLLEEHCQALNFAPLFPIVWHFECTRLKRENHNIGDAGVFVLFLPRDVKSGSECDGDDGGPAQGHGVRQAHHRGDGLEALNDRSSN